MAKYTPMPDIPKIHNELRETFGRGVTKPLEWRRCQLLQLARFVQENSDALVECLRLDLGRPKQEAIMGDIGPSITRCLITAKEFEEWVEPEHVHLSEPHLQNVKARVEKHPKGVVLIISPWNYPVVLTIQPLYGAIAAGCCAAIKPSEMTLRWSSFLAQNLPKYLDPSAYQVIQGGVLEITKVFELKWDHIFYTGNGRVGRIILAAAAKHLTPLTLELGGKPPVIVDATADISIAAKRILWGKINNAGQICVAPDYIIAEKSIIPSLVQALRDHYKAFFPQGAIASDSYGRIVSDAHFTRLKEVLARSNGTVVFGGTYEEDAGKRGFEPTVVVDVEEDDSLLEECGNIWAILPIIAVDTVADAIEYLNDRDHPLVIYLFSKNEGTKRRVIAGTTSGNVWIGDTFQPVGVNEMPFGGVGESGYGNQCLRYSFDNFTYKRGVIDVPDEDEPFYAPRYPPYTRESLALFSQVLETPIPDSDSSSL